MHWSAAYVGCGAPPGHDLPCYWLAQRIYRDRLGVDLPDTPSPVEQAPRWRVAATPAEFDLALFRRGEHDRHVGVVVRPGMMIHLDDEHARVARIEATTWAPRLLRFYRHESQT